MNIYEDLKNLILECRLKGMSKEESEQIGLKFLKDSLRNMNPSERTKFFEPIKRNKKIEEILK
jgi:hypothetical protein